MLTSDDAIAFGLRKYRELYHEGKIPPDLEDKAVLSAVPSDEIVTVCVTFSIRDQKDPFFLFKADVNRSTGEVNVQVAEDSSQLANLDFADDDFVR